jgi:hypothetical protein
MILNEFIFDIHFQVFTNALWSVVEQLKQLRVVKLVSREEGEPTIADLDGDYETLLTWGYLRPSLIVVTFTSKSVKTRQTHPSEPNIVRYHHLVQVQYEDLAAELRRISGVVSGLG